MQKQIQVVRFPQAERTNSHKQKTSLNQSRKDKQPQAKDKPAPKQKAQTATSKRQACTQAESTNLHPSLGKQACSQAE